MARPIFCDLCGKEIRTIGHHVSLIVVAGEPEFGERDACGDYCVPCHTQRVNQIGGGRPDFAAAHEKLEAEKAVAEIDLDERLDNGELGDVGAAEVA